ncbi:hypothetical protein ACQYRI_12540 [Salmonella enterica]
MYILEINSCVATKENVLVSVAVNDAATGAYILSFTVQIKRQLDNIPYYEAEGLKQAAALLRQIGEDIQQAA